jgi:hypothetical protein
LVVCEFLCFCYGELFCIEDFFIISHMYFCWYSNLLVRHTKLLYILYCLILAGSMCEDIVFPCTSYQCFFYGSASVFNATLSCSYRSYLSCSFNTIFWIDGFFEVIFQGIFPVLSWMSSSRWYHMLLTGGSLVTDGRVTQNFRKEKVRSNNSNDGNYLLLRGFSQS